MPDRVPAQRKPRFCGQCGVALPSNDPRFCIECGHPVRARSAAPAPATPAAATGPTVRLPNAPGEQSVVGGTVKLPSSGAIPPGLWFVPELPGPDDIMAIYVPLRAVVGGWSGTINDGWRKVDHAWAADGSSRNRVRFEVDRSWFAAPHYAEGAQLHARIGATSFAEEGHTRRGFRYRVGANPPMEVVEAWWADAHGRRLAHPVPQIQLMAPPRVRRVSDYPEKIARLNAREADVWAKAGAAKGLYRMPNAAQQRTPVGRGIPLFEVSGPTALLRLAGLYPQVYRAQIRNPLICKAGGWPALQKRIRADAQGLGLDMDTDAVIEWWLDRQGYDGAVLERGAHPQSYERRMVVAFRRSQIAEVVG